MNKQARAELQALHQSSPTRTLYPEKVVEFAKDPETHLHKYFTWDDGEAGQAYRLLQARQLIRVAVHVLEETQEKVRAYVSLTPDRKRGGGGYRATVDVLDDKELLRQLLDDAKAELQAFRRKYQRLAAAGELSAVFDAIETTVLSKPAPASNQPSVAAAAA